MYKIHPKFLDDAHLRALWREGLCAQKKVTEGMPWHNFETSRNPQQCMGAYLSFIASVGLGRGIRFNHERIEEPNFEQNFLPLTLEELEQERQKLKLPKELLLECHPIYSLPHL